MTKQHLKNVRTMDGAPVDLAIADGHFAPSVPEETAAIDGEGRIVIPGLVEAHTHLNKSTPGLPRYRNEVGPSLMDRITNEREVRAALGLDAAVQSKRQAILSVSHGTTHIRSHVDIDTDQGLAGLEGVMATREKLADLSSLLHHLKPIEYRPISR